MTIPRRGEVWITDFGVAGKVRPAVVLSVHLARADRPLVAVVPRTTSRWGSRFEVSVALKFSKPGAFNAQALASVPVATLLRHVGTLAAEDLARVEAAVRLWLGL